MTASNESLRCELCGNGPHYRIVSDGRVACKRCFRRERVALLFGSPVEDTDEEESFHIDAKHGFMLETRTPTSPGLIISHGSDHAGVVWIGSEPVPEALAEAGVESLDHDDRP